MIYTVGHSSRSIEDFVALLRGAGIACLVDVRAIPESGRHPQFARAALLRSLAAAGIRYEWEGRALGGRRSGGEDSRHAALKEAAFRAYAAHMAGGEFRSGVERVLSGAAQAPTALLCAERLPAHCHRSLIADWVVAHGGEVTHLLEAGAAEAHRLHPAARLRGGTLHYDGDTQGELAL